MMLAAVAFLLAADDPGGWSKAKWGMTDAQLSEVFGAETLYIDGHVAVHLTVGDILCHAMMHFDKDGHLNLIGIGPVKIDDMTDALYLNLQEMLVQKYGRPWKSDEENGITSLQWTFPTTLITLQRMKLPMIARRNVSLTYERVTPASNPL
jgi:hypothetical protein